jgi:hypothetical protein
MNGKLEYEYFRLQKLEKMFWNRTYGHVRIIYFSETNFDANGKCTMQDEKRSGYSNWMVLSSRSKILKIRLLCFNYSLVKY